MENKNLTKAVVIKRQDYREYDSLVVFYTKNFGKISLIARGTKRTNSKLASHIEPINLVDLLLVPGKGLDYAGAVYSRNSHLNLKENLDSLHYAHSALYWLKTLTQDKEEDAELFALLAWYLEALDKLKLGKSHKNEAAFLFFYFAFRLLFLSGYYPQINNCLNCQKKLTASDNYFDLLNGGVLCAPCFFDKKDQNRQNYYKIQANILKVLRLISEGGNRKISLKMGKDLPIQAADLAERFLQFRL